MADTSSHLLHPNVMWAQRKDKVYVTVNVEDVKNPTIELTETQLKFKGKGGTEHGEYEVTIELFGSVLPEESKYIVQARNIPFVLKKKEEGPFWPRLLKPKGKVHWLKTDFNKWRDEDDSDVDEKEEMNLEEMMHGMGGLGAEDLGKEEEDSDDEDLPDLE